jgi:hypothetical protein
MPLTLAHPRQHSAQALREAEAPIGLAVAPDPIAGIVKPVQWHQARLGRRHTFLSVGDADAYDRGYRDYPNGDDRFPINTPYSRGFFDAEKRATVNA